MRVRVGVVNAKELELDVEDPQTVIDAYEKAAEAGAKLFWVTQNDGVRFGIVADHVGYIEIEAERASSIGFSAAS